MGFPLFDAISSLLKPVHEIIDEVHTSEEEKLAAKQKLFESQIQLYQIGLEQETRRMELQADIVKEEARGHSALQRNWRPILMLCFTAILANNYIILPYCKDLGAVPLEFPGGFWALLTTGVGGYIAARQIDKSGWPGANGG